MAQRAAAAPPAETPVITGESRIETVNDRLILRLPAEASRSLPSRSQVAVDLSLGGHRVRTVLEPDGRKGHWIAVDRDFDSAAGLSDGEAAAFELTVSQTWPEPQIPADLTAALADADDIADLWRTITPMARWEWVRWVGATKSPATRQRRVEVTISKLRDGKRRPCCFDLSSCTDPDVAKSGKLAVVS